MKEKMKDHFNESWKVYCTAIVHYAEASSSKPKELKHALRDVEEEGKYTIILLVKIDTWWNNYIQIFSCLVRNSNIHSVPKLCFYN